MKRPQKANTKSIDPIFDKLDLHLRYFDIRFLPHSTQASSRAITCQSCLRQRLMHYLISFESSTDDDDSPSPTLYPGRAPSTVRLALWFVFFVAPSKRRG